MKCPVCGKEAEEGGLVANNVVLGWIPLKQFQKKGLKRLLHTGLKTIGRSSVLLNQTLAPNAFFCADCKKVFGVFDVTND